ncbi:MAG: T9SS C-terminal target domain-containing protein, partial [Calditrichaeota bacterium]
TQITGSVVVSYSDVQGGYSGTGNIDADPLFADTVNYYLTDPVSPAIDAGNPDPAYNDPEDSHRLGFACWPALGELRNDMGAYGGPGVICNDSVLVAIDDELPESVPSAFKLAQNYPNPFNPSTTIEFTLPEAAMVKLTIYNALGQEVATLVNGWMNAGTHQTTWEAGNLPSGIYFYRLSNSPLGMGAEGNVQTRKMLLMK